MKYYKYPNPYITDDEVATDYIEVDGDLIMRQLSVLANSTISSNVDFVLGDKPFDYEEEREFYEEGIEPITIEPITKEEFDVAWHKHLRQHEARWVETKKAFSINTSVTGCINLFYPQGIIVELGPQIFGVTDHEHARASTSVSFWPRCQISGIVTGYDEENQWIELGSPQVHADKPCDLDILSRPQS